MKSLSNDENHGIDQPMRFLYGSILAIGARETIANDVSRACRWAGWPTWSMNIEQPSQPASCFGPEHEVVEEQLAASLEQVGQRGLSVRPVEDVVLVDPDPR